MMKGESEISLCYTCSNCECIFQAGIVREQCEFYIEKNEYCRAIDDVLEIIDKAQTYKMAVGSTDLFIDRESFRDEVLALKGGEV